MKNFFSSVPAALGFSLLLAGPAHAQTAFNPSLKNFAYIGKAGFNNSTAPIQLFNTLNPSAPDGGFGATGTPITVASGTLPGNLNGAGINPVDGFLYAMNYPTTGPGPASTQLYRVGSDAVAVQVGTIPPPTASDAGYTPQFSFVNATAGMIDLDGHYFFSAYSLRNVTGPYDTSNLRFYIGRLENVNTLPAGAASLSPTYLPIDISDPVLQTGFANYMSSVAALVLSGQSYTNADGGFQDFDVSPADRKFYSYLGFPSAPATTANPTPPLASHLIRIDTLNHPYYWGKVAVINSTANTTPNYESDGAWFDAAGNFYTSFVNGRYAKVDLATGTLNALNATGLPLQNGEMRGDLATNASVIPLPVQLLAFKGAFEGSQVTLNWEISDAHLLRSLAVERSAEGKKFLPLGTLDERSTRYTDVAPLNGAAYYRLKLTGLNGQSSYSPVLRLTSGALASASVFPNPVADVLTLSTPAGQVRVHIADLSGRTVFAGTYGGNALVPVRDLAPGTYSLRIADAQTGTVLLSQLLQKQ